MQNEKALRKIINQGVKNKLSGLEDLLSKVRELKIFFLSHYNPQLTLEKIKKHTQAQAGPVSFDPNASQHRDGTITFEQKGGQRVLNFYEARKKVKQKNFKSLQQLLPLLQELLNELTFTGTQDLAPDEITEFLDRVGLILKAEKDLQRAIWGYDLDAIDSQGIARLLGEKAAETLENLKQIRTGLESSGLLEEWKDTYRLTRKGLKIISGKILKEIFDLLKRDLAGKHLSRLTGEGSIDITTSRPYAFGLPLHINLSKTVMNAAVRQGRSSRLALKSEDFEVYEPELSTRSAVILMLDRSKSMKDRNNFFMAKKVTLALNDLIQRKFSRDHLEIIGFSTVAEKLLAEELPYLLWDADRPYTNIQDGLTLSRRILRHIGYHNKQIMLITDGEPTAHSEGGKIYFQFPPHPRTIEQTLAEVKQCTREGIVINTFMMAKSRQLTNFVEEVYKINPGRAYYADSGHLGEYIIVNYLHGKR